MLLEIGAPQTVFVQVPSPEQQGLETRDKMHPFYTLQCPELGLRFRVIADTRKCLCRELRAG